jgi:thiamine-phosphate pyrophosphorylase
VNPRHIRYAVTDRTLFPGDESARRAALLTQAARLAAEGVDYLQLREKNLPAGELTTLARALLKILRNTSIKLLINSRADIAIAIAAPGVHLTASPGELTPRQVHTLYAHAGLPTPTVTISCHTLEDLARLANQPIDAILFGPIFEKSVAGQHVTDGKGLALLQQACAATSIPVLALGGLTPTNTQSCLDAGAAGIAAIRLFIPSKTLSS